MVTSRQISQYYTLMTIERGTSFYHSNIHNVDIENIPENIFSFCLEMTKKNLIYR